MNPQQIAAIVQSEINKAVTKLATKTFHRAIVVAVSGNKCNVNMEGSTQVHPNILCMSGYQPVVGDQVLIVNIGLTGANFLCIGRTNTEGTSGDPIGEIQMTLKATADPGFLMMKGGTFNKADYPAMHAMITANLAYGSVTSTTFTLTDMTNRVPVGKSTTGTFASLGATGGEETHVLTTSEMPSHNHNMGSISLMGNAGAPDSNATNLDDIPGSNGPIKAYNTKVGISWNGTMGFSGGGGAHNNLQPYKVVNFQVRAR